jgi:hypothetical protein
VSDRIHAVFFYLVALLSVILAKHHLTHLVGSPRLNYSCGLDTTGTKKLRRREHTNTTQHPITTHQLAYLVEEKASATDSAYSEEELLSLAIRPKNRKRGANTLKNEADLTAEEISPRRNPSKLISRAQWRRPAKRQAGSANLKASRGVVDVEDQMGRVRRRPTGRINKLQRYAASRLKR